jgi:hypothetical protein
VSTSLGEPSNRRPALRSPVIVSRLGTKANALRIA